MYRSEYIVCFRSEISFVPLLFSHRTPFLRPYWQIYFNSTSNHNFTGLRVSDYGVVSYFNSTSNHNLFTSVSRRVSLFLIPILHQTTTLKRLLCGLLSCSSFQFYIKPQPITASSLFIPVVPHSNSTSNHNFHLQFRGKLFVVPHSNSTSNHNVLRRFRSFLLVVPHSNSTSNHNMVARLWKLTALFLIPILHQTTTVSFMERMAN